MFPSAVGAQLDYRAGMKSQYVVKLHYIYTKIYQCSHPPTGRNTFHVSSFSSTSLAIFQSRFQNITAVFCENHSQEIGVCDELGECTYVIEVLSLLIG